MRRTDPEAASRKFFRAGERVFALNGRWFFATREGEIGPFSSRAEVLSEIDRFVREKRELAHFQKLREQEIDRPASAPVGFPRATFFARASGASLALIPLEESAAESSRSMDESLALEPHN